MYLKKMAIFANIGNTLSLLFEKKYVFEIFWNLPFKQEQREGPANFLSTTRTKRV